MNTDLANMKAKEDHIHKKIRKWKDKYTNANSAISRMVKENNELSEEADIVRERLADAMDKVN